MNNAHQEERELIKREGPWPAVLVRGRALGLIRGCGGPQSGLALWGPVALVLLLGPGCAEDTPARPSNKVDGAPREASVSDGKSDRPTATTDRGGSPRAEGQAPPPPGSLSEKYPGDQNMASDPAVLFHDDFEQGWGRWDGPESDTSYLHLETDPAVAHGGTGVLRSTVTRADLEADQYISASPRFTFPRRVETVYWRFYARFKGIAPNPHHWVRMSAGDESYGSSGLANTVPPGDQGFWFDFDVNNDDIFNFYVYWYKMRSSCCNDGTTVPGCEGDQGHTNHYGNYFQPPNQTAFTRDQWICIEIKGKANSVGSSDGELAFWINDQLIDEYRPGHPEGTWLRDAFHTGGCEFSACEPPAPFEGFDFRSSDEVRFKRIFLDAYYERNTFESKKAALEAKGLTVSDEQTIYYDDVVVATERIGCKVNN